MVEISNARYTELVLAEQLLHLVKQGRDEMPSYEFDDLLKLIFGEKGEKKHAE